MDRQSKFDREIRKKMAPLEAEPSMAVWAGVRGEIGMGAASETAPVFFRIAVAAAIAMLIGLGIFFNRSQNGSESGAGLAGTHADTLRPQVIPAPAPAPQEFATEEAPRDEASESVPLSTFPKAVFPEPVHEYAAVADTWERPQLPPRPELRREHQQFVEQERKPKKITPERAPFQAPTELDRDLESYAENESTSPNKRSIKVPSLRNLKPDQLRSKSGAILASLANGANDYLGMDTRYEEKEIKEDVRETEFSANFGLFKVKRVRTIKD